MYQERAAMEALAEWQRYVEENYEPDDCIERKLARMIAKESVTKVGK